MERKIKKLLNQLKKEQLKKEKEKQKEALKREGAING